MESRENLKRFIPMRLGKQDLLNNVEELRTCMVSKSSISLRCKGKHDSENVPDN